MKATPRLTNIAKAALLAIGLASSATAQLSSKICYDLEPRRFGTDYNIPFGTGGTSYFDTFSATSSDPSAPPLDVTKVRFEFDFTGPAPTQSLAGPMCITWEVPDTSINSIGFSGLPTSFDDKGVTYNLCHTCYDFTLDLSKFEGEVIVYDGEKNIVRPSGEGTYYNDVVGDGYSIFAEGKGSITACFSDLEVCYCIPETSSAMLSLLGVSFLLIRRKR